MRKLFIAFTFLFLLGNVSNAQRSVKAPTFNAKERAQITKLLDGAYIPVFSKKGELAIATNRSIRNVKALRRGGFSKVNPSVANNVFVHKGYIYKSSQEILQSMKSKLGKERFQQLEAILSKKPMRQRSIKAPTFNAKERAQITKLLDGAYIPVFSKKGELAIATNRSIRNVKALRRGGFSKVNPSVANNVFVHKGYIYKSSQEILQSMKSKLGKERFQQLEAILSKR